MRFEPIAGLDVNSSAATNHLHLQRPHGWSSGKPEQFITILELPAVNSEESAVIAGEADQINERKLHDTLVGTKTIVTNADGSITVTKITGRQVFDLRVPVLAIAGIAFLLVALIWLAGRKKSN